MKLIEIDFGEGIDNEKIVIRANHIPTLDEANEWLSDFVSKYGKVTRAEEISYEEAEHFYDLSNEKKWKTFG